MRSYNDKLKHLESRYRELYDGSPEMHRSINSDGIILDCNYSYARNLGYLSKDEVIGHSAFEHVAEKSYDVLRQSVEQWCKTGAVRNVEVWFKRKDGTEFPALINANSMRDENGKVIGSNTVIADLTRVHVAI